MLLKMWSYQPAHQYFGLLTPRQTCFTRQHGRAGRLTYATRSARFASTTQSCGSQNFHSNQTSPRRFSIRSRGQSGRISIGCVLAALLWIFAVCQSLAAPLDQWTQVHPLPNWTGVAFGANRFVSVGEFGSVQSSSDGITWSGQSSGTGSALSDVLFANGKFIAVGGLGKICVSTNGTDWTAAVSGVANTLTGLAYGNGTYVAVGSLGTVLTSTDGLSWTKQPGIPTSLALQSVTYGSNLFLAISGTGEIIQSPDGITWTSQPSQGGAPSKVVWVNNRFVIVDYAMKLSANGIDWAATNFIYPVITNLVYAGGYYVGAGGGVGSGNGGVIRYSLDLTNWTTALNDGATYGLSAIAYGNGTFAAAGMHGLIRTSTDHLNWPLRKQSLTYLGNLYGVKYVNHEFMAVGDTGVNPAGYGEDAPYLFSGGPGGNWTRRPSGAFSAAWDLAYGQGLYVVATSFGVRTSTNGNNWNSVGTGLSSQLASVTFANNLFVLTSWSGGISTSPDGVTWTARTSGSTRNLWGAAYGNGLWVAVGQSFSSSIGAYITSGDGITWANHSFSSANLRNIAFGGGTFVIVGDSGYLASSTTGLAWTRRGSGTAGTIYGVGYGDGYFAAVGTGGYLATSPDGITWTVRNSGTSTTLNRIAYGGGTFVATGSGGLLMQSASTTPSLLSKTGIGGIVMDLVGGFDRAYGVEATTNLDSSGWSRLTTLSSGQRQFTDSDTTQSKKFYRLTFP
jgi:hypothetical protein